MIKNLTPEEIELLKTQIYSLKEFVVKSVSDKTPIDMEFLQKEYNFLYKNSKDLFHMIIRDFGVERHATEHIAKKFDKLIDMLVSSLVDFNSNNIGHYQASKKYEKEFRHELWPDNLKHKFDDA